MKCIGAVSLAGAVVWVLVLGISVAVRRAARKWDEGDEAKLRTK